MLKEDFTKPPERFVESLKHSIENEVSKGKPIEYYGGIPPVSRYIFGESDKWGILRT